MPACLVFSGVIAVRDTWLISAKHPDHLDHCCQNPDCRRLGCKGDRLERVPPVEGGKYRVVIEHSKTEDSYHNEPLEFLLGPSWSKTVEPWVELGHNVVTTNKPCP